MKGWVKEFQTFIMRGNVVDLAVGLMIGVAFGTVVDSIVKGLFTPIIGLICGGFNFSYITIPLYKDAQLMIGAVITAIINFVVVGFCLFLVVKAMNRFKRKENDVPVEPTPSEKLLTEIRDLLKAK